MGSPLEAREGGFMSRKSTTLASILLALAVSAAAQEARVFEEGAEVKVATPQCSGGVVYDDGSYEVGYSVGSGSPTASTIVSKFDLPGGTTSLDQACVCFSRDAADPATMPIQVLVYDDIGPSGQPGTLVGTVNATAT